MLLSQYWVTAYRFFLRQKIYALLNGLGLTVGMASCLIMVLIATDDIGFDQFHPHADRIYRVAVDIQFPGRSSQSAITPFPLGTALKQNKHIAEDAIRIIRLRNLIISARDSQPYTVSQAIITDANFFNFFGFDLQFGDKTSCLSTDSAVVLTQHMAKKLLRPGQTLESLLGQQLVIQGDQNRWTITGIAIDPPRKSHFRYDVILPLKAEEQSRWDWFVTWTYMRIPADVSIDSVKNRMRPFQELFYAAVKERFRSEDGATQIGIKEEFILQPIRDIHLRSHLDHELEQNSRIEYTYALLFTAAMVLMISCFNYVNVSTARWTKRAKEIGVRKMIGASEPRILSQFLGESLIMTFSCLVLAIVFVFLTLPLVNFLTDKSIRVEELTIFHSVSFLFLFGLVVSLISGVYPAYMVSSFDVSQILRNQRVGLGGIATRKRLVVMQFFFGIFLSICTITDFQQVHYLTKEEHLGFDKNQVLIIENALALEDHQAAFKADLLRLGTIEYAAYSSQNPIDVTSSVISQTTGSRSLQIGSEIISVDPDFTKTLGVALVWGKIFDTLVTPGRKSAIINQSFLKKTFLESPEKIKVVLHNLQRDTLEVTGLFRDFRHKPFKLVSGPLLLVLSTESERFLLIRPTGSNMAELKEQVEKLWQKYVPQTALKSYTLSEKIEEQLYLESELGSITLFFTILAIFVACVGLLGLAAFSGEKRAKEIAIRKVYGARSREIVYILVRQYGILISISFLLAASAAWYLMTWWLGQYPSRIEISPWVVFLSGFSCLLIALAAVSYQSLQVAQKNPSETLRSE